METENESALRARIAELEYALKLAIRGSAAEAIQSDRELVLRTLREFNRHNDQWRRWLAYADDLQARANIGDVAIRLDSCLRDMEGQEGACSAWQDALDTAISRYRAKRREAGN